MASTQEIYNRALQKLGAKRVSSVSEDSTNARACTAAYDAVRLALLRKHTWRCAIAREALAADDPEPEWGKANSFTLPANYVRMLPPYPEDNFNDLDWEIEGRKILTDDSAPLYIRYIYDLTDPQEMDSLFREALATDLAFEICEQVTQSNTKKESLRADKREIIAEARRVNAIESIAQEPPADPWLTVRA